MSNDDLTAFDREEIAQIGVDLHNLARAVSRLAVQMEEDKFSGRLYVKSGSNMRRGIKDIKTWFAKVAGEYASPENPEPASKPSKKGGAK